MLGKILLPLDGSELAETAIPYVRDLAGQLEAEVYLLHACPPEHKPFLRMHQTYLNDLADGLRRKIKADWQLSGDPKIQAEVILDEPVNAIFEYIKQKSISMVALTSHGASGPLAWAIGNVADKVVRGAGIPVLLIRIKEGRIVPEKKGLIQKILLPLDNSDASKIAIPYAVQLAKKLKSSIALFSVVQTIYTQAIYTQNIGGGGMGPGFGSNFDLIDVETKKFTDEYLMGIADEIRKEGVEVTQTCLVGMDAAFEILEMEKKSQPDLVVMATRGRSNISRWVFGSVAEKILREGDSPILMVKEAAK
jgi:nucleotide-binding universal stress UspA family protein